MRQILTEYLSYSGFLLLWLFVSAQCFADSLKRLQIYFSFPSAWLQSLAYQEATAHKKSY